MKNLQPEAGLKRTAIVTLSGGSGSFQVWCQEDQAKYNYPTLSDEEMEVERN